MRLAVVLGFGLLLAGTAEAEESLSFVSPTGNILCIIEHYVEGSDEGTWVRCDMRELTTQSYQTAPAECDLDWGTVFAVFDEGEGRLYCHGDTNLGPNEPVLPYGEAVSLNGISCVSARTGVTCTNAEGHGFTLSKARQRIF
jgi:hypothetical protein